MSNEGLSPIFTFEQIRDKPGIYVPSNFPKCRIIVFPLASCNVNENAILFFEKTSLKNKIESVNPSSWKHEKFTEVTDILDIHVENVLE
jgi:hypothetical protein